MHILKQVVSGMIHVGTLNYTKYEINAAARKVAKYSINYHITVYKSAPVENYCESIYVDYKQGLELR